MKRIFFCVLLCLFAICSFAQNDLTCTLSTDTIQISKRQYGYEAVVLRLTIREGDFLLHRAFLKDGETVWDDSNFRGYIHLGSKSNALSILKKAYGHIQNYYAQDRTYKLYYRKHYMIEYCETTDIVMPSQQKREQGRYCYLDQHTEADGHYYSYVDADYLAKCIELINTFNYY